MKITIRNHADIPNKHIRFIKWKIGNIKGKFNDLLYFEAYISKEGFKVPDYKAVLKLGVPGHDLVLSNNATDLKALWRQSFEGVQRALRKYKEKNLVRGAA